MVERAVIDGGHTCRIVSSILEPFQSIQQDGLRLSIPNVAYDSAHTLTFGICRADGTGRYSLNTLPTVRSNPDVAFRVSKMHFA